MARPRKEGLSYFPFDVDFFSDKKMKRLRAKFGTDGIAVYVYLLCEIYRSGYYIDYDEDLILDISDDLSIRENTTRQIIDYLLSRSLFDDTLAKSVKVLTAASIQRRYQEARKGAKRDIAVDAKVWVLKKEETHGFIQVCPDSGKSWNNDSFSGKNPCFSENNDTKYSKVKKSKINTTTVCAPDGTQGHTQKEIMDFLSGAGYTWSDREIQRFWDFNNKLGWKLSLEQAARRWEENRKPDRRKKQSEPEMTASERAYMDSCLSLVNRFGKEQP